MDLFHLYRNGKLVHCLEIHVSTWDSPRKDQIRDQQRKKSRLSFPKRCGPTRPRMTNTLICWPIIGGSRHAVQGWLTDHCNCTPSSIKLNLFYSVLGLLLVCSLGKRHLQLVVSADLLHVFVPCHIGCQVIHGCDGAYTLVYSSSVTALTVWFVHFREDQHSIGTIRAVKRMHSTWSISITSLPKLNTPFPLPWNSLHRGHSDWPIKYFSLIGEFPPLALPNLQQMWVREGR
ncbi:uncharacterized protein BDW43DRAFT_82227 [Aspergillus alliaceus]|uniref:uncharacterized protein n=1 Tax=Petromyces alliaceus TaxID=209559 RepID=UPI0012A683D0|nr:uncharacterized protein BDW43DRAFT_82227 [Aspergillus alliaceus]KAB8233604.1 hypothetical protein BDW43DRAFT_82227 [Aspergillus alliaceus]